MSLNEVRGLFATGECLSFERTSRDRRTADPVLDLPGDDRVAAAIGAGERDITIVRRFTSETLGIVVSGDAKAVVSRVVADSVADAAGILEHDHIIKIDGANVTSTKDVTETLRMAGTTVVLTVLQLCPRFDQFVDLPVDPYIHTARNSNAAVEIEGNVVRFTPVSPDDDCDDEQDENGTVTSTGGGKGGQSKKRLLGEPNGLTLLKQRLVGAGARTTEQQVRLLVPHTSVPSELANGPPDLDVSISKSLAKKTADLMTRMKGWKANPTKNASTKLSNRLRVPRLSATPTKEEAQKSRGHHLASDAADLPLLERSKEIFSSTAAFRRALFQLDKLETSDQPVIGNPLDLFKPSCELSSVWRELLGEEDATDATKWNRHHASAAAAAQQHRGGEANLSVPPPPTRRHSSGKHDRVYRCLIERGETGSFGVTLVSSKLFPFPRIVSLADRYKVTKNGLREGDRVLEVNGQSVFGQPALATAILKTCDQATFVLERDSTPVKPQMKRMSFRVKAATHLGGDKSKIPVRSPDLQQLLAETNHAQRKIEMHGPGDSFTEQLQVEYATLKRHISQANWYYTRLSQDMSRLEDAECALEDRERELDSREADIETFVAACNDLMREKEGDLERKRVAYERELGYRQIELERLRRGHEAALQKRVGLVQAALAGKLGVVDTLIPLPSVGTSAGQSMHTDQQAHGPTHQPAPYNHPASHTGRSSASETHAAEPNTPCTFEQGDRVRVEGFCDGTVKCFGDIGGRMRVGIELDDKKGFNDGAAKGKRHFWCAPGYGVFVVPEQVASLGMKEDLSGRGWSITPDSVTSGSESNTPTRCSPQNSPDRSRDKSPEHSSSPLFPNGATAPKERRLSSSSLEKLMEQASAAAAAVTASQSNRRSGNVKRRHTVEVARAGPGPNGRHSHSKRESERDSTTPVHSESATRESSATPIEDPSFYDDGDEAYDETESDSDLDSSNFDGGEWSDGEFGSFSATRVITGMDDLPSSHRRKSTSGKTEKGSLITEL